MVSLAAQTTMGDAVQWVLGLPLPVRLLASAAIIFGLSLLVSITIAATGRSSRTPGSLCLSVGIATGVALAGWSIVTRSGPLAVYQLFGGAIAVLARAVLVSNRLEVLDWVSDRVDRLNYKIAYVALALLMALPFIVGSWPAKPRPRAITRGVFDAIEKCADIGKPVLLINAWRMSSRGENQPQFECIIEHLMRRRVKFIMLSLEPDTTLVGRGICQDTEAFYNKEFGDDYLRYGRDWLLLGYTPVYYMGGWPAWVENMKANGMVGAFRTDYAGGELSKYEIMQRPEAALREEEAKRRKQAGEAAEEEAAESETGSDVDESLENGGEQDEGEGASDEGDAEDGKDTKQYLQLGDFGLIMEVHFTGTIPELIGLVRLDKDFRGLDDKPKIMTGLGTVDMVVNQMLTYYDAGDLAGILAGMQGAGEYSELLVRKHGEGPSRRGVSQRYNPYSMGVLFVLSMIVLGNLCALWKKLREWGETGGVD